MKNKVCHSIIILTLLFLFSSCASTEGKKRYKIYEDFIVDNQLSSLTKIRTFKMINWSRLDDRHIILSSHHNKNYLVTLSGFCPDLNQVNSIALKQSMEYSLITKFDSVIVSSHHNQECPISKIHELNKDQLKEIRELK
jgi:hypothetical protein